MNIPHNPGQMSANDLIKCAKRLRNLIAYANVEGVDDAAVAAELRALIHYDDTK